MKAFLLLIFWGGAAAAAVNALRNKRRRARLEAEEAVRQKQLSDRLDSLRQKGEEDAVKLIERLKKEEESSFVNDK